MMALDLVELSGGACPVLVGRLLAGHPAQGLAGPCLFLRYGLSQALLAAIGVGHRSPHPKEPEAGSSLPTAGGGGAQGATWLWPQDAGRGLEQSVG